MKGGKERGSRRGEESPLLIKACRVLHSSLGPYIQKPCSQSIHTMQPLPTGSMYTGHQHSAATIYRGHAHRAQAQPAITHKSLSPGNFIHIFRHCLQIEANDPAKHGVHIREF